MTPAVFLAEPIGIAGLIDLGLPALAGALSAAILARLAGPFGLIDRGGGHGLHREAQAQGKCLVGGLALAVGLVLSAFIAGVEQAARRPELPCLLLALFVGLLDDRSRSGLGARAKLALQGLPALAFALLLREFGPATMTIGFAAALGAQNLANTYDNADGVLLLSAALALAAARPAAGVLLCCLLAFNLHRRVPATLLLGDSGSHLIALLLLCEPRAWGAFFLPALDLARVVLVRRQQGRAWWIGDRVHMSHRLAARGLGPGAVALTLALAALPAIAAGAFAHGELQWGLGLGSAAAAFALLLRATPAVDGRGVALRAARSDSSSAGADRAP